MQRYGGGSLYAAIPLHMQRSCFWIRTNHQSVTKAQLYHYAKAYPLTQTYYWLKFMWNPPNKVGNTPHLVGPIPH